MNEFESMFFSKSVDKGQSRKFFQSIPPHKIVSDGSASYAPYFVYENNWFPGREIPAISLKQNSYSNLKDKLWQFLDVFRCLLWTCVLLLSFSMVLRKVMHVNDECT